MVAQLGLGRAHPIQAAASREANMSSTVPASLWLSVLMMQLFRFWIYFDTIPHSIAWLSCAGFVFGEPLLVHLHKYLLPVASGICLCAILQLCDASHMQVKHCMCWEHLPEMLQRP